MKRFFIFAIAMGTLSGAFGYGVDVQVALRHRQESLIVPINSMMFRMRQPDGQERVLVRNPEDSSLLNGEYPWVGKIRMVEGEGGNPGGSVINVVTAPNFRGEKTEFCFFNGRLRFMSVGNKDYEFDPTVYAVPTNAISSLWPERMWMTEKEKDDTSIWRKSGRFSIFSRNPNRGALILAHLALIVLGVTLFASKWRWRCIGGALGAIFLVLLFLTESRGGFLAVVSGILTLVFFRFRCGLKLRQFLCVLAAGILVMGGIVFATGVRERFTAGIVDAHGDASNAKRLAIWREVPRMIATAPLGWGFLQSGPSYNSWFEGKDRMHMVGDLFNDHMSRFVEGGFVFGGLYLFLWAFLLVWTFQSAWRGKSPVPLAVLVAYFVAASFNPMNRWWPSFILPVLSMGFLFLPGQVRSRFRWATLGWAAALTLVALVSIGMAAFHASGPDIPLRVSCLGRQVIAGTGTPTVWVVEDGFVLDGNYYGFPGKEIREFYRNNPKAEAIGLVSTVRSLPPEMGTLVLAGKSGMEYLGIPSDRRPKADCVVFVSPPAKYDIILENADKDRETHVIVGEFAGRLEGGFGGVPENVHIVPGVELYVPGWLETVVKKD